MTHATPLSTIIALARAGALDHAWAQYCAAGPGEPETPYYRAATEAEALLLLGRREDARDALAAAVAAAPQAWEDHGSTLRQFVAIEAALGGDPAWLDLLRPPVSLAWAEG